MAEILKRALYGDGWEELERIAPTTITRREFDSAGTSIGTRAAVEHEIIDYENFEREMRRGRITQRAMEAILVLEDFDTRWATLTAAERLAAQRLALRISAKLCRLMLNQLEAE